MPGVAVVVAFVAPPGLSYVFVAFFCPRRFWTAPGARNKPPGADGLENRFRSPLSSRLPKTGSSGFLVMGVTWPIGL
eukprot:7768216-Pyramimonas_sp.AAC.1